MKCAGCGEEVEDLLEHRNCFEDRVDVLLQLLQALEHDINPNIRAITRLTEAVERNQWVGSYCPHCRGHQPDHEPDCVVGQTIARAHALLETAPLGASSDADALRAWRQWADEFVDRDVLYTDDGMRLLLSQMIANLRSELRDYVNKAETRAREADVLRADNRRMADMLARILGLTKNPNSRMSEIVAAMSEPLSPFDPLTVELAREQMLVEIDNLLQDREAWVGGRLDSITALLDQRDRVHRLVKELLK